MSVRTSNCSIRPRLARALSSGSSVLLRGHGHRIMLPTAEDDTGIPEGHMAHAESHSGQMPGLQARSGLQPARLFYPNALLEPGYGGVTTSEGRLP